MPLPTSFLVIRDFVQMQVHRRDVAEGQDQAGRLAQGRADRAEDIDRLGALIVWGNRPGAAPSPAPCDLVLLADSGFIAKPDPYFLARRPARFDLRQDIGEVFLKTAIAAGFCA